MRITPDGARYLALGRRQPVPRPFVLRWLLPLVCTTHPSRWRAASIAGVVGTGVATVCLAPSLQTGVAAGLMMVALPSSRFNLRNPVLVDAPAMALAALAAVLAPVNLPAAVAVALVAGACKETAPGFAALYAWNPWLLLGLVAPAIRAVTAKTGPDVLDDENAWILEHPVKAGWKYHRAQYLDGLVMVTPWGGALVALAVMDLRLGVLLAVAYAQLLVATDSVRLYQWSAPLVCVAAATAVPPAWLPILVVLTVWNPCAGNGV